MFLKLCLNTILKACLFLLLAAINITIIKAQGNVCQPFSFNLAPDYRIGQTIRAFSSADFNNDGFVDLVTANQDNQSVSVYYGDGLGGFAPAQTFPVAPQVVNVLAVGDMNHDGRADIIGASGGSNFNTNKITVLLNNGEGGFSAPVITDLPSSVIEFYALKVGDFTGDGHPDIAALTKTNLNIFPGNGLGAFSLSATLPWDGERNSLVAGNFNNDAITDLAVTGGGFGDPWELGIVLGTAGNAVFNNRYNLTGQPAGLDVGEFNGDGITDIMIAAYYPYANNTPQTRFLEPWLGGGGGAFTAGTKVQFPVLNSLMPVGVAVGDFNTDGKQDAVVNFSTSFALVYGNGSGTFQNPKYFSSNGAGAMLAPDVNQDNKKDLLFLRSSTNSAISVLLNTNNGFNVPSTIIYGGTDIVAADFNGDGRRDMVTVTDTEFNNTSEVVIALNDGQNGLLPDRNFGTPPNLTTFAEGDFNGDGKRDVVTAHVVSNNPQRIGVFLGDGTGNLTSVSPQISGLNGIRNLTVGDFNDDGFDDVFIIDSGQTGFTLLSQGNGAFTLVPNFSITFIHNFAKTQTGDFNRDGKLDLAVPSVDGIKLWLGNGNGTFAQGANQTVASVIESTAKGDFNGDGFLDVAALTYTGTNTVISKMFGDGNGGFNANSVLSLNAGQSLSLTAGDFNADGRDDLAFISSSSLGNLVVIPSAAQTSDNPTPIFYWIGGISVPSGGFVSSIVAADYNGDGKIDIGFTNLHVSRGIIYNNGGQTACLSINDATVTEGNSGTRDASFTVSLSAASAQDVYVNYTLEAGTAAVGTDIQNVSGRLKIPAGQASAVINVPVNGDVIDEFDENFVIRLANPANAALQKAAGIGTILDNDDEPALTITDVTQAEGFSSQNFVFNVALSAPSGKAIGFRYTTADGTAVSPRDYGAATAVVNIAPGATTATIFVFVAGENTYEPTEDFFVNLSQATNVSLADNQGRGIITNDDPVPFVSIQSGIITEGDTGTINSAVTVQLSNPTYLPVSLNVLTSDGTAIAGSDYVASDTRLTIPAEQISATTPVQILGDTINEPSENFNVNVYNVTNATVNSPQFSISIIDDEWVSNDFDRDGRTDFVVFRPSERVWYFNFSLNNGTNSTLFGLSGDIPVSGDYSGDGRTDIAVFRPTDGTWYTPIAGRTQQFGVNGDIPVHGDYDNDGRIDLAVFRPGDRTWYIQRSSNGAVGIVQWGLSSDVPVPADYDGDGKTDIAVFRPATGVWYILRSTDLGYSALTFGQSGDKPVPADYDGDGKADMAIFRAGVWYVFRSSDLAVTVFQWGIEGDKPVPGNYDGDSKTDFAVYRDGTWWVYLSSTGNYFTRQFGLATDIPIPFVSNN